MDILVFTGVVVLVTALAAASTSDGGFGRLIFCVCRLLL